MESHEIRVGNVFQWSRFASMGIGLDVVTLKNIGYHNLMDPVPISFELLEEMQFERINSIYWGNDILKIERTSCTWQIRIITGENKSHVLCDIQYVHQLQNIYYPLMGIELPIIVKKPWEQ